MCVHIFSVERDKRARQGGSIDTSSRYRRLPDGSLCDLESWPSICNLLFSQQTSANTTSSRGSRSLSLSLSPSLLPPPLSLSLLVGRVRRTPLHRNPETWLNHGTAKLALNIPNQPRALSGSTGIGCLSGASKSFSTRTCQRTKKKNNRETPCHPPPLPSPPFPSQPSESRCRSVGVSSSRTEHATHHLLFIAHPAVRSAPLVSICCKRNVVIALRGHNGCYQRYW
ncbi:hypothetical protein F4775DRAFT_207094 [Biscogniauxia sp. FL1348]|nr:hypothetical protein F4775DRAFT_207094 [Biscogniauxia sp. FL1348]